MSDTFDIVVVGEGAAGFAAAWSYAERGKKVAVVAKSPGAAAVSSGAWDFGTNEAWRRPLVDWREAPDWKGLHECAGTIARALAPALRMHQKADAPLTLPTSTGSTKNVYAVQAAQATAELSAWRGKRVALVSAPNWRWHPEQVAARWTPEVLDARVATWEWGLTGADWPLAHVSTRLRDDHALFARLLAWLKERAKEFDLFLFPSIFADAALVDKLDQAHPGRWGECLAAGEPAAGARLQSAFRAALDTRAITRVTATELRPQANGRRLEALAAGTASGWRTLAATTFVLATGRYLGGGLTLLPGGPRESLLGLPLYTDREHPIRPGDPEIFRREAGWREAGVWIDELCRPIGSNGKPAWDNLQACGSLIGGIDYAKAGLGIGFFFYSGRQCALVGE